jgi:hypothetical protein
LTNCSRDKNSKESFYIRFTDIKAGKKMSEENTQENENVLGFEEVLLRDIKKRESFFTDFHLVDFANFLGYRETEAVKKEGYQLYVTDAYIIHNIMKYFNRVSVIDDSKLYYLLITKFTMGYKVLVFQYEYDLLVEWADPIWCVFTKHESEINDIISSSYHLAITLSHSFYNITEYYGKHIANYK